MAALDLSRANWRKGTRSNGGGACVEIAFAGRVIAVRDSKNPNGPTLAIPSAAWRSFTAAIKADSINP